MSIVTVYIVRTAISKIQRNRTMKNKKIDILMRHYGSNQWHYECSTNQARTLSDALINYCARYRLRILQTGRTAGAKIAYYEYGILKAIFSQK